MAFNIADLFKVTGLATGSNTANLSAAGALLKLQGKVQAGAEKIGLKIGAITGGAIFSSLEKGAKAGDTIATQQILQTNAGINLAGLQGWAVGILAAVAAWLVFKD